MSPIRKGVWLPEIISTEIKRKIEAKERPFHSEIILPADCIPDLEQLGLWITARELTHQLKVLGYFKIPPMAVSDKFTSLWALRNLQQYKHLAPLHIRKLYFIFKAETPPPLTGDFASTMPVVAQPKRKSQSTKAKRESRTIAQQQRIESLRDQLTGMDRQLEALGHPITDYGHIDFNNYHSSVRELQMRITLRKRKLKELK